MRRTGAFSRAKLVRLDALRNPLPPMSCLLVLWMMIVSPSSAWAQCFNPAPSQVTSCDGYPGCYDIYLSWSPGSGGGYPDYFNITNVQTNQTVQVDGIGYDWVNLQPGTNYTFTIVGHNCAGDGPSASFTFSTPTVCPGAPGVASVTQGTSPPNPPYVTLGFTINQSGATPAGFHFYSRHIGDPSSETRLGTTVTGASGTGIHNVDLYTDYYQREFAATSYVVSGGHEYESPRSNWVQGWPAGTPIPPVASGNYVSPIGNSVCYSSPIRFRWAPVNNARKWNLQVATDLNFTSVVYAANNVTTLESGTGLWFQETTLQPRQLYYWRLQPISALGAVGSWSTPTSFTMGNLAITSPTGAVTWNIGSQQTVQWSLICGSGDKVELFPNPTIVGDHLTGTSYVLSNSASGGQLTFTVPCVVTSQGRIQITRTLTGGITEYAYSPQPIAINFAPGNGFGVKSGPGGIYGQIHNTPDALGGSYVCWSDRSNGQNYDVFVARLDVTGRPMTGWPIDVTPGVAGDQYEPLVVGDGAGGAYVAWSDERGGSSNPDIYALHLNSIGATIAGWGAAAPSYGGIAVVTLPYLQRHPSAALSSDGALLVAWSDARDFLHNYIYTQKVSAAGAFAWNPYGVQVSEGGVEGDRAALVSDGQGGAYLSYVDSYGRAFLQRILAADGSRYWSFWSSIVSESTSNTPENTPALATVASGAVMMSYLTISGSPLTSDLRAYYFNANTQAGWDVSVCNATGDQTAPVMVSDGSGGATIAWRDERSGTLAEYAARVLGSGAFATGWPTNGLQIAPSITMSYLDDLPAIAPDGYGGATFAWEVAPGDIFAREVSSGACAGPVVTLCNDGVAQDDPTIVFSTGGIATVAWRDARCSGTDTGVFASTLAIPNATASVDPSVMCFGHVSIGYSAATDALLGAPNDYELKMSGSPITEGNFDQANSLYSGPLVVPIDLTISCTQRTYFACKARYGTCYWTPVSSTWVMGNCRPNCEDGFGARHIVATIFDLTPRPNPSNGAIRVQYSIRRDQSGEPLELAVYDLRGRLVAKLDRGGAVAGAHEVVWNAMDPDGRRAAPGLYFLRLKCGAALLRREVVLLR